MISPTACKSKAVISWRPQLIKHDFSKRVTPTLGTICSSSLGTGGSQSRPGRQYSLVSSSKARGDFRYQSVF